MHNRLKSLIHQQIDDEPLLFKFGRKFVFGNNFSQKYFHGFLILCAK